MSSGVVEKTFIHYSAAIQGNFQAVSLGKD